MSQNHQRAGDQGKPGIHIGNMDAKRAKKLGLEDDSPSTVYTEALKRWSRYREIKNEDISEAKNKIMGILKEMENKHDIDREDLLESMVDGEIV